MRSQSGFTLIEILMVVLLVSILAAVSIPQFIDFRVDAKDAAARSAVGILRTAIVNQYAQASAHCGNGGWATSVQITANDITSGAGAPCTAAQIPNAANRRFVASTVLPDNPWSGSTAASKNSVTACAGGGCTPSAGTNCAGAVYSTADGGWCYNNATGQIWPNSKNSTGPTFEYNF